MFNAWFFFYSSVMLFYDVFILFDVCFEGFILFLNALLVALRLFENAARSKSVT